MTDQNNDLPEAQPEAQAERGAQPESASSAPAAKRSRASAAAKTPRKTMRKSATIAQADAEPVADASAQTQSTEALPTSAAVSAQASAAELTQEPAQELAVSTTLAEEAAPAKPKRAARKPRAKAAEADLAGVAELTEVLAPEASAVSESPAEVSSQVDVQAEGQSVSPAELPAKPIRRRSAKSAQKTVGDAEGSPAVASAADADWPPRAESLAADVTPLVETQAVATMAAATGEAAVEVTRLGVLSLGPEAPDAQSVFQSVLAGEFDQATQAAGAGEALDDAPEKRVLLPDIDAPKLHKVLAQSGIGSRRDMEQAIADGRVSVNGETAHTGMRVSFGDRVALDGKPVRVRIAPPPARVIAYHKPAGEVVSFNDPEQRPTVFRNLPRLQHGKWQSVGRLDLNTEGLLLFTTSGDMANKLMHPRFGVEREYAVRVLGTLEKEAKAKLLEGVEIEGQPASFKSIEDGGGEGVNHWYRVVITEGRNREVRKLFDAVGLTVSRLIRIRYGCVVLPRGLRRGAWVDLSEQDVKALRQLTALPGEGRENHREGSGPVRGGKFRNKPLRGEPRGEVRSEPRGDFRPDARGEFRGERGAEGEEFNRDPRGRRNERAPAERTDTRVDNRFERAEPAPGFAQEPGERQERRGPLREGKPPRQERGDRTERTERPPRFEKDGQKPRKEPRAKTPRPEFREPGDPSRIPNPLVQTFDRRGAQNRERPVRDDEFYENGPIPNPLQQTFDRRFVQGKGHGNGLDLGGKRGGNKGGPKQPDPMQTSVGYIGADAFVRKLQGRGGGGGGRRGGR